MGNKVFCTRYSAKCYQIPITSEVRLQWYPASLWYSQKHPRCHFLHQLFHLSSSHCSNSSPLSSTSLNLIHAVNPLTSPKNLLKLNHHIQPAESSWELQILHKACGEVTVVLVLGAIGHSHSHLEITKIIAEIPLIPLALGATPNNAWLSVSPRLYSDLLNRSE